MAEVVAPALTTRRINLSSPFKFTRRALPGQCSPGSGEADGCAWSRRGSCRGLLLDRARRERLSGRRDRPTRRRCGLLGSGLVALLFFLGCAAEVTGSEVLAPEDGLALGDLTAAFRALAPVLGCHLHGSLLLRE